MFDLGRPFDMPLSVWAAYTQQSQWQVYNGDSSRPFRETNDEPELFAAVHPDVNELGWRWRLAAIGLNHQSNGRGAGALDVPAGAPGARHRPGVQRLRREPDRLQHPPDHVRAGHLAG
jgi:outer membrane phospholipase A